MVNGGVETQNFASLQRSRFVNRKPKTKKNFSPNQSIYFIISPFSVN